MFRTIDTTTSNLDVCRFSITLDDTFRCLVKFPCDPGYILLAKVVPTFKFPCFGDSSLENIGMNMPLTFYQVPSSASNKDRALQSS